MKKPGRVCGGGGVVKIVLIGADLNAVVTPAREPPLQRQWLNIAVDFLKTHSDQQQFSGQLVRP